MISIKNGGMILDIHELVSKVDGLNSVSTAKNWITMIKDISGHEFPISKFTVGRNRTGRLITNQGYDFSIDDVDDFQSIADKKTEMGLKKAIETIYGNQWEEDRWESDKAIKSLENRYKVLYENYNTLFKLVLNLKQDRDLLQKEIVNLRDSLQTIEVWRKGLPFNLGKNKSGK